MALALVPTTIAAAKQFIAEHHRHHRPPVSGLFAAGAADDQGRLIGVAVVGRLLARLLADGWTAEVTRVCTDGTRNACSLLYGACWRAARALGYRRLVTYTLPDEGGASLRAAGWTVVGETRGGSWSRAERPRSDPAPTIPKLRWQRTTETPGAAS